MTLSPNLAPKAFDYATVDLFDAFFCSSISLIHDLLEKMSTRLISYIFL